MLPDGTKIKHSTLENNHWRPANSWIEKFDKNNESIFKKVFLVKLEKPLEANVGFDSALVNINSMLFSQLYKLKDNTYILLEAFLPFAIRVRNDLTSPYFENNPQFLVLDKEYYTSGMLGLNPLTANGNLAIVSGTANAATRRTYAYGDEFLSPGAPRTAWIGARYEFGGKKSAVSYDKD